MPGSLSPLAFTTTSSPSLLTFTFTFTFSRHAWIYGILVWVYLTYYCEGTGLHCEPRLDEKWYKISDFDPDLVVGQDDLRRVNACC